MVEFNKSLMVAIILLLCHYFTEHHYRARAQGPENDRTMVFFDEARVDGLQKRVETPNSMEEHYKDRDDFLFYRFVEFGKRAKRFGPAESVTPRPIMVRKFTVSGI